MSFERKKNITTVWPGEMPCLVPAVSPGITSNRRIRPPFIEQFECVRNTEEQNWSRESNRNGTSNISSARRGAGNYEAPIVSAMLEQGTMESVRFRTRTTIAIFHSAGKSNSVTQRSMRFASDWAITGTHSLSMTAAERSAAVSATRTPFQSARELHQTSRRTGGGGGARAGTCSQARL